MAAIHLLKDKHLHEAEFALRSSKGDFLQGTAVASYDPYIGPYEMFTLTGPQWTDITWFTLSNVGHPFHQHHNGWDDIRYSFNTVPEPGWTLLVGGGLMLLAITRRKRS